MISAGHDDRAAQCCALGRTPAQRLREGWRKKVRADSVGQPATLFDNPSNYWPTVRAHECAQRRAPNASSRGPRRVSCSRYAFARQNRVGRGQSDMQNEPTVAPTRFRNHRVCLGK
jgi:hypothetical protein